MNAGAILCQIKAITDHVLDDGFGELLYDRAELGMIAVELGAALALVKTEIIRLDAAKAESAKRALRTLLQPEGGVA